MTSSPKGSGDKPLPALPVDSDGLVHIGPHTYSAERHATERRVEQLKADRSGTNLSTVLTSATDDTAAAEAAISQWSIRARETFTAIHQLKHDFFEAVYTDAPWESCTTFADESRRFSAFVKLVFAKLQDIEHLPSSTEINSWFWLFKRKGQLVEAGVPESVLPKTRKVQEALNSVTADCKSDAERLEVMVQVLESAQHLADDKGLSAAQVRQVADQIGVLPQPKPKQVEDFKPRHLGDMTTAEWDRVCGAVQACRKALKGQFGETQRKQLQRQMATLEDITRHQTTYVLGVFDRKGEAFVGFAARVMTLRKLVFSLPNGKAAARTVHVESDHKVIAGDELAMATLPLADAPQAMPTYFRLVGCRGDRKLKKLLALVQKRTDSNKQVVEPIDLKTLQAWLAKGGIPLGTCIDEVIEPDWMVADSDDHHEPDDRLTAGAKADQW